MSLGKNNISQIKSLNKLSIASLDSIGLCKCWIYKIDDNPLNDINSFMRSKINDINFLKIAYEDENMTWFFPYTFIDLQNISFFVFQTLQNNGIVVHRSIRINITTR